MTDLPGIPKGAPFDERASAQDAANKGLLVEAGWIGLRAAWISDDASAIQIEEMRNAFFAGAQHIFSTIMSMQDDGLEETPADLERMDKLSAELLAFFDDFKERRLKRPTVLMAAGLAGQKLPMTVAIDRIDRALRDFSEHNGKHITAADIATMLTFPLSRIATHGSETEARDTIGALRTALDVLEDAVARKHPPQGVQNNG